MKIEYRTGNLIDSDEVVICHGCNAKGRMGSGIADEIRLRLPVAYEAYRMAFEDARAPFEPGVVVWAFDMLHDRPRPRIIGNLITQNDYGRDPNICYVSYPGIEQALNLVTAFMTQIKLGTIEIAGIGPIHRVGFPLIGSGYGNGSWSRIAELIEATSGNDYQPVVYTLDGVIPTT